jgi:hypothetical protein
MKPNQIIILPNKYLHICIHYFLYVKDISNYSNLLNIIMCVWFDCNKVKKIVIVQKIISNKHFFVLSSQPWFVEISFENETIKGWWKCM